MTTPLFLYVLTSGLYDDSYIVGIFTYDRIRQAIKDVRKHIRDTDAWETHLSVKRIAFNKAVNLPY